MTKHNNGNNKINEINKRLTKVINDKEKKTQVISITACNRCHLGRRKRKGCCRCCGMIATSNLPA